MEIVLQAIEKIQGAQDQGAYQQRPKPLKDIIHDHFRSLD